MGVLDKFLDIMKLSDEDDYDSDDFFDDDEDFDDFDDKPKKGLFKKAKTRYDDDDDDDFDDMVSHKGRGSKSQTSNSHTGSSRSNSSSSHNSKVTPMRPAVKKSSGMEVCMIRPTSVDDSRNITETLLSARTVILNLEGLDMEIAQRIIDFISGAAFAIDGNLQKISNYIFLVTPANVEISGDMQDLMGSSFEVPSIRTRF